MTQEAQFLKDLEVHKLTGLGLSTLRNYRHLRKGPPYVKVGRAVRYERNDVIAWLNAQKIQTKDSIRIKND
jgi:predicted DNA-binding transcriptional regulator AlpA